MELSRKIVIDSCKIIEDDTLNLISQLEFTKQETLLKPAPKIFKEDGHLLHSFSAKKAHLIVKGLSPYPAAFVNIQSPDGEILSLKIFESSLSIQSLNSGTLSTDGKTFIILGFEEGSLLIQDIQLQSKKRMTTEAFLRGFQLNAHWKWL